MAMLMILSDTLEATDMAVHCCATGYEHCSYEQNGGTD